MRFTQTRGKIMLHMEFDGNQVILDDVTGPDANTVSDEMIEEARVIVERDLLGVFEDHVLKLEKEDSPTDDE